MNIPDDLHYAATHEWARLEADGSITVGITDFGQDRMGQLVYVSGPEIGAVLKTGDAAGVVESSKTAVDIHAPVDGEIIAFNDELNNAPEAINDAPYEHWIFKMKPSEPLGSAKLLDAGAYRALIG